MAYIRLPIMRWYISFGRRIGFRGIRRNRRKVIPCNQGSRGRSTGIHAKAFKNLFHIFPLTQSNGTIIRVLHIKPNEASDFTSVKGIKV
jgi:hypothetical protein